MSDQRKAAQEFAHKNHSRFLSELKDFISIASISTDPTYKNEMQAAAEFVAEKLRAIGISNVEIMSTPGHPIVYGEYQDAGPEADTMIVYGHYDVQPPDPLDLWESGPFKAEERDGYLFGRGSSDMKGQVLASLFAIEAALLQGNLPVNLKFLIEGEEENSSPNLEPFIEKHKDLLASDFALNPDSGMLGSDTPSITYSLRGLAYFEVSVQGPSHDLHSGLFGGTVRNPANELSRLISGMHDNAGRVTLEGFYDKVRTLSDEERKELARLPGSDELLIEATGAPSPWGETGFTNIERAGARPTLDVNGFISGYTGEGMKTVLPAKASAKISMRLVADQEPDDVHNQLVKYMETYTNPGVTWEVDYMSASPTAISDVNSPAIQALVKAMETVWGKRAIFNRGGGTIPVVAYMQHILGVESVLTGFSLSDDHIHSPNERMHLDTWYKGIDALIHFIYNLAE
ncbi:MAG: dipeptidase [Chloroflexi bacterium]|nr:dipeptidase [Chloroflexota bacterium]